MKKIHKLTFALGILAGCIGGAYAASVGQIDTETANIEFRSTTGITGEAYAFETFTAGSVLAGKQFAIVYFHAGRTLKQLGVRWLPGSAAVSRLDNRRATLSGQDDNNHKIDLMFQSHHSGHIKKEDEYTIYPTNGYDDLILYVSSATSQYVDADIYTVQLEATAWEL